MRFVQDAARVPSRCAFYPQIGPSHDLGFVESDMLVDDHFSTYVSVTALREIAEKIPQAGIAPRSELTLAQAKIADLEREVEDLKAQVAEADKFAESAEYTLAHFGTRVKQKPGRKPAAASK